MDSRSSKPAAIAGSSDSIIRRYSEYVIPADLFWLAFHIFIWVRVQMAPEGPQKALAVRVSSSVLLAFVLGLAIVQTSWFKSNDTRRSFHRAAIFVPGFLSYFQLRIILPALQPHFLYDHALLSVDRSLFIETPAVWLEMFMTRGTVEWFSFFYYSHFLLMISYVLGSLFFDRGRRLYEFVLGVTMVAVVGHALYTIVPGLGPIHTMTFHKPIEGGLFWGLVMQAVNAAGAQMDIFPSLHTGFPTFFALHAYRHRHTVPFKYVWHITAFFTMNIVIATVFLRWHYAVDIVAGLFLSFAAARVVVLISDAKIRSGCCMQDAI